MSRSSLTTAGLLSALLLASSVAAAAPATAEDYNLECAGPSGTLTEPATWFICDLSASQQGALFSNQRWTRDGVAFPVGNNRSSVKFTCNTQSVVAIGVTFTDTVGGYHAETIDWTCCGPW